MRETPLSAKASAHRFGRAETCFALVLFSFFCAFAQVSLGLGALALGPGFEGPNVGKRLAHAGEFADPFGAPTGSTAHIAPFYPAILGLVFKVFGITPRAVIVIVLLNAALLGMAAAMLPVLSRLLFKRSEPGIIGGILLCMSGRVTPQNENVLCAALFLLATVLLMQNRRIASGVGMAASLLANPISLLAFAVIGIQKRRWFAGAGALALLLISPWIVRNWLVIGYPYFIRDNFGLELFLSNQDQALPEMVSNPTIVQHPTYDQTEAREVAVQGEASYNHAKFGIALGWIVRHPARFASLCLSRTFRYWFPSGSEGWPAYLYQFMNLVAAIGLWIARANPSARFLALAAFCYSLPYSLIQSDIRYGFPTLGISALFAGHAVCAFFPRALLQFPYRMPRV